MSPSGADRFAADPDRLRSLGMAFVQEAGRLGSAIANFEASASGVEQAFGLLGPSDELYFEYLGLVRDTIGQLHELRGAVERVGEGLEWTAGSYEQAEIGSAVPTVDLPV